MYTRPSHQVLGINVRLGIDFNYAGRCSLNPTIGKLGILRRRHVGFFCLQPHNILLLFISVSFHRPSPSPAFPPNAVSLFRIP